MAATDARCRVVCATAPVPGAIAILQLTGDVEPVLAALTGRDQWPLGRARLACLAGVDDGLVARLTRDVAQVMPHGGPRVIQRLIAWLEQNGAATAAPVELDPCALYPEAADRLEAVALAALPRAASPLAIDLLLAQPARWRANPQLTDEDRARSRRLDRLLTPPIVVVAGPANTGKSTLSNALLGRAMSIAAEMPGTTRDYTSGRLELAGLVVDWYDTPGLRDTNDPIERRAVETAGRLMERADLLIALTDAEHDWPQLPRDADLRVASRSDLGRRGDADLQIAALHGEGLEALVKRVRDMLVPPADLVHPGPWLFDARLLS